MNDGVDVRMLFEYHIEGFLVCNVELLKIWSLSADEFYAVDDFRRGIVKAVYNDNFVASFE
jgi:hypothetical protein